MYVICINLHSVNQFPLCFSRKLLFYIFLGVAIEPLLTMIPVLTDDHSPLANRLLDILFAHKCMRAFGGGHWDGPRPTALILVWVPAPHFFRKTFQTPNIPCIDTKGKGQDCWGGERTIRY